MRKSGNAGLACPRCGNNDTRVLETREKDRGASTRRLRKCEACFVRFYTTEKIGESLRGTALKQHLEFIRARFGG